MYKEVELNLRLTIAQIILKALGTWGIKNIYGVSGNAILPFIDTLGRQQEIKFYSTANEQEAAFMACGEARVTGKPSVCIATEGPGTLNLVNGVADAYHDNIPMLIITGQVATSKLATNAKQYFNQQQLFSPITGFTNLLTRPESTVETLKIALEKAIGDNIPCHISIPQDIFSSPAPNDKIPVLATPCPPEISGNIEEAINIIKHCKNPIIITGKTAIPYKDIVLQLANFIGAGIIPAQGAKGIYPGTEKYILSGLGEAHIPPIINRADCIILIGASPYEHKFIPPKIKVIHIDTRPQNLVHGLRAVSLTGDMKLIIENLLGKIDNYKPNTNWQNQIEKCHDTHLKIIRAEVNLLDKPIPQQKLVSVLNDIIPEDALIIIDSGEFMHWFDRGFIAKKQQVIISDYWRCMGCALPLALGAQVAYPKRKVVVLAGEGGFIMTMQEILTAVRYSLPVIIIIFNNNIYSLEKHRMQKSGMHSFGVEVYTPDFATFAIACGAKGIRIEKPEILIDALKEAMRFDQPVVIDIITSTDKPAFI